MLNLKINGRDMSNEDIDIKYSTEENGSMLG